MKHIYLHVGPHKTATSSIQTGLFRMRDHLSSQNVFFPLLPSPDFVPIPNHSAFLYSLFADQPENYHINIGQGLTTASAVTTLNSQYEEYFRTAIAPFRRDITIFSGEDMILLSEGGLARLRAFLVEHLGSDNIVKVIYYLRTPHEWFASLVQQWVRGGWVLDDLYDKNVPNIRVKLEPFVRQFGPQNILIAKFEEAIAHPNGPVGHLLSLVSDKIAIPDSAAAIENRGLCAEAVNLVSALNKIARSAEGTASIGVQRDYLAPFLRLRGTRFVLPKPVQERAWRSAQESLAWIEATFGIDTYKKFEYQDQPTPMWAEEAITSIAALIAERIHP